MLDSIPSTGWSEAVTLTVEELWQVRRGAIRLVSGTPSGPNDGIILTPANDPIRLPAGITVQVREHRTGSTTTPVLVRIPLADGELATLTFPDSPVDVLTQPFINPTTGTVGTVFTVSPGVYSGVGVIVTRVLTFTPAEGEATVVSSPYTASVAGVLSYREDASNSINQLVRTVSVTVTEEEEPEPTENPTLWVDSEGWDDATVWSE